MGQALDVVIVNWNSGSQLRECLQSLKPIEGDDPHLRAVFIVDNASVDGSADGLDSLGLPVEVLRNGSNCGFALACNQGARRGKSEFILFLNPDAKVFRGSINSAIDRMANEEHRATGIIGIQLVDSSGNVARSCARFPRAGDLILQSIGLSHLFPRLFPAYAPLNWDHLQSKAVDHVMGSFYLVRRSLFELLEGFDERFFVYLEDLDFSLRAMTLGWRSFYLAEAQMFHKGGGTSAQVPAARLFYSLRSRIRYASKHFTKAQALTVALATLTLEFGLRLGSSLLGNSRNSFGNLIACYSQLWRWCILGVPDRGLPVKRLR